MSATTKKGVWARVVDTAKRIPKEQVTNEWIDAVRGAPPMPPLKISLARALKKRTHYTRPRVTQDDVYSDED